MLIVRRRRFRGSLSCHISQDEREVELYQLNGIDSRSKVFVLQDLAVRGPGDVYSAVEEKVSWHLPCFSCQTPKHLSSPKVGDLNKVNKLYDISYINTP